MATVLIVEDDPDLGATLEYNFQRASHQPMLAKTGSEGIRIAREKQPDVVLLDIMLPDIPGTDVCHVLKGDASTARIPVIMLTAKGEEIDRVVGFEVGAEDYIVKPFSVRELLLRTHAVLRRGAVSDAASDMIAFGSLRVDDAAHRVWLADHEIELTLVEYKLLLALYRRRNRVQTRSQLLDVVWGVTADVTTRTVDTHVKRLREKLGETREYIETVRGVGYRFVGAPPEAPVA